MENAHLRMGKLTFVRQTRDSVAHVSLHLDRLVAEPAIPAHGAAQFHFVSIFGGDQEVAAFAAAIADGQRLQASAFGTEILGSLGEKPTVYWASLQIPGRKRPVRHLIAVSKELLDTTFGANGDAKSTILFDRSPEFLVRRLAMRFGLPHLPEWADWFGSELVRRRLLTKLTGLNCTPVLVRGTKLSLLGILGHGLRHGGISIRSTD
ncbi:MAG: hypothetical protein QM757_47065 [Paludibaculum sp.]